MLKIDSGGARPGRRPLKLWIACIAVIFICCCVVIICCRWCRSDPITTVLLVRHAEAKRIEGDLTLEGQIRAKVLAHVAGKAELDAIYITDILRTQQTAAQLASVTNLEPIQMPSANPQAVVNDILTNHAGGRVMVVGHSDTVPQIIELLGGPTGIGLTMNEYDNLFVLTRCGHRVRLVELHYGNPTPP